VEKKIVILDTYVKKLTPPDESTRPSRRIIYESKMKQLVKEDIYNKIRDKFPSEEAFILLSDWEKYNQDFIKLFCELENLNEEERLATLDELSKNIIHARVEECRSKQVEITEQPRWVRMCKLATQIHDQSKKLRLAEKQLEEDVNRILRERRLSVSEKLKAAGVTEEELIQLAIKAQKEYRAELRASRKQEENDE